MNNSNRKEIIYYLYWNKGKSLSEIGKILNHPFQTIHYWMERYNIPRRSFSEAQSRDRNGFYGKKHTAKFKKKISLVHKGKIPWNKGLTKIDPRVMKQAIALIGQKKTLECRRKLSEAKKGKPNKFSEEACRKMAELGRKKIMEYNKKHPKFGENNPNWKGGSISYYGPNWQSQRRKILERDNHICQRCGAPENGREHDIHHIIPFRKFGLENYKEANKLNNLETLCIHCHKY